MNRWQLNITKQGKAGFLVFSYENGKIYCMTLYAADSDGYSLLHDAVAAVAVEAKGQNKIPSDHEAIHVLLGQNLGVHADQTKAEGRHFHWVFAGLDAENGFVTLIKGLKTQKFVTSAVAQEMGALML
ncbi:hypothetical protein [Dyella japonica]|uniref:Uncharacterized protein n=1 Tax=Dyella japonica A8 TaxID=1217721 RepID=A0A075K1I8_9GAMM|nr:hypothetical protein [Dyella japonica]AIF48231.1 hypothetical protein HY57_13715 [Dyella japonica A8]